jgi:IclR family transcriptional regulator, pca regulon regulatory protein
MTAAGVGVADRETDFVQSLQRGLAVICAFDADNPTLTLSDVARATGLARAAARRFLLTLVDLGYIRVDGRQFRLSPQVLELGRPYLSSLTLPEIALPHMREATNELRESCTLAILDGTDIVYVAHTPAKRILSVQITIGARDVAFATSLGRVLLAGQSDEWLDDYLATIELPPITPRTVTTPAKLRAELMRIRRHGYALVDQELEEGLRAIAAPLHDEQGNVIAAANFAVHASRWSNDDIRNTLLPRLVQTTTAIDRDTNAAAPTSRSPQPADGASSRGETWTRGART